MILAGRSLVDQEDERVDHRLLTTDPKEMATVLEHPEMLPPRRPHLGSFVIGSMVGGIVGAIVGTALSPYTRGVFVGLYHLLNRRLSSAERDQLRFELLLQ